MISAAQARKIIQLCGAGVTHQQIAVILELPWKKVINAVTLMKKNGVDVPNPREVREEKNKVMHKAAMKELKAWKIQHSAELDSTYPWRVKARAMTKEDLLSRSNDVVQLYKSGTKVTEIAKLQGVAPTRIYGIIKAHEKKFPGERLVIQRRQAELIAKGLKKRAKAEEIQAKRRERSKLHDDALLRSLGLEPTPSP